MKGYVYTAENGLKSEWKPPHNWNGTLPAGVTAHPADHPFFKPLPAGHQLDHSTLPPSVVPIPPKTEAELAAEADAAFKAERADKVAALTVEVNGRTYDADETAQRRMKGAADAARFLQSDTIPLWVLADNTVVHDLPVADLEAAHSQAFQAMAALWVPEGAA